MTPEERFTKIENLLRAMTERQVQHDQTMGRHEQAMQRHEQAMQRHDRAIEQHNAAIQDLIRLSRILLDSQTRAWDAIEIAGAKIDKLSEKVDRILDSFQKPNGNE
jgi:hypothetical protein